MGYNRIYVHVGRELAYDKWWEGFQAGRVFVTNGPLLRVKAAGQLPGHVFTTNEGKEISIAVEAACTSRDAVRFVEIVVNGNVERRVAFDEVSRTGKLGELKFKKSGWFLVRAVADNPRTFRFASTGPFYVEVGAGNRRISKSSAQFNIVAAYDAEQVGDLHFLVMEFVEGTNLARMVEEKGPLPVGLACDYCRQAALGLQHAHEQGMV